MRRIAIVGLGYVGLGLALALSKNNTVLGYDISKQRVNELRDNIDCNQLYSKEELSSCLLTCTDDLQAIKEADFFIVCVSTPAYYYEMPNLEPLENATKKLATILKKGDIVVFESTVYPGTTEEICLPLLEEFSHLKAGVDFNIGYSPERISPGDNVHTLANTTKVISAQNKETLAVIEEVYKTCCDTLYPVSNVMTAEAVKILENTQRNINIALLNEFSEIMHAMDLSVHEILEAAKTKWSFMPYKPGFVGGHCISIDPLYLAFKAKRIGAPHDIILAARKVNDGVTIFVKNELIHLLTDNKLTIKDCRVGIFGLTYKENIPDIRNSLALKFVKELQHIGLDCKLHDPCAEKHQLMTKYHLELHEFDDIRDIAVAIILVGHDLYRDKGINAFLEKMPDQKIIMDIPNLFNDAVQQCNNVQYWSL